MCLRFTISLACLIIGACASLFEKRLEVLQEPADDIKFYLEAVYELNW